MACKNHPDRKARRHCFHCRNSICPACQLKSQHHVFCSQACAEAFRKTAPPADVAQKLEQLDAGLNEDIREFGETIADEAHKDFEQLETELDRALTALATMVEGSAAAAAKDLDRNVAEMRSLLDRLQRQSDASTAVAADRDSYLRQQLLLLRDLVAAVKEQSARAEAFEEFRTNELPKMVAAMADRQERANEKLSEATAQVVNSGVAELGREFQKAVTEFSRAFEEHMKRLLDDIAALNVAFRGNWNDVVESARGGAEKSILELKGGISKSLDAQLGAVVREQKETLAGLVADGHKELKKKISLLGREGRAKYVLWGGGAAAVLVGLIAVTLAFFHRPGGTVDLSRLEDQLTRQEATLRELIESKLATLSPAPRPLPLREPVGLSALSRGSVSRRDVAFTFDGGGENAAAADDILAALKRENVRATMFVTGRFIDDHPDLVRRMVAEGHEVANHLVDHKALLDPSSRRTVLSKEEFLRQLQLVAEKFEQVTDRPMARIWRAPYGDVNPEVLAWAREAGYTHVGWTRSNGKSLDTYDWVADPKSRLYRSSDQIVAKILDFERSDPNGLNGAVVLMHLGSERAVDVPSQKLSEIIKSVSSRGYKLVTVSDLLRNLTVQR